MVDFFEIVEFLNRLAPPELAESYDNVGVLAGGENKNIEKVLITLDTDSGVAKEAVKENAQLIVSHHPLIFNPIKNVTNSTETGKTLITLIKNDISLFAMHTNFDSVKNGMCDILAKKIFGENNYVNFNGENGDGIGRVVNLNSEITLGELCEKIKKNLNIPYLRIVGDLSRKIKKSAIVGGGGAGMTEEALKTGADVYISGDFKYQHGRDAYALNLALIEITHYDAEIVFAEYMKKILENKFKEKLTVVTSKTNKNVWRTV